MTEKTLEINEVLICGNPKIPKRYPTRLVLKTIDGQNETYEGELIYFDYGTIVKFKTELDEQEIKILDRLARRVTGRMHRTLRAQEGYSEAEWNAKQLEAVANSVKGKGSK